MRKKYNLRSTKDIPSAVNNRRAIIEDPLLKPLSDDKNPEEYEKVTDAAQKLKDILDIDKTFLYDDDLEQDPLFEIEEILDHKITEKGRPLFKVRWISNLEETWVKMSQLKEDGQLMLSNYIMKFNLRGNRYYQYKWARRFLYKVKMLGRALNIKDKVSNRKSSLEEMENFKLPKEMMHGIPVPRNAAQALELDKHFKNGKWSEVMNKEISMMFKYEVFELQGKNVKNSVEMKDGNMRHLLGIFCET